MAIANEAELADAGNPWLLALDTFEVAITRVARDLARAEEDLRQARARYRGLQAAWPTPAHAAAGSRGQALDQLTAQERRVAALAAAGKSNLAIAAYLNVSVYTVKTQMRSILRKLSIRSRAQLPTLFEVNRPPESPDKESVARNPRMALQPRQSGAALPIGSEEAAEESRRPGTPPQSRSQRSAAVRAG